MGRKPELAPPTPEHQNRDEYGLDILESAFVEEYLVTGRVDKSYRRALEALGRDVPEATKDIASRLFRREHVKYAIARRRTELREDNNAKVRELMDQLMGIASSDIADFKIGDDGSISSATGNTKAIKKIKKRVRRHPDGSVTTEAELETWDKLEAIKLAAEVVDLYNRRGPGRPAKIAEDSELDGRKVYRMKFGDLEIDFE